jgi:hypothetical protein
MIGNQCPVREFMPQHLFNTQKSYSRSQTQSNTQNGQRPPGGVGQDKIVPKQDRVASAEAASREKDARARQQLYTKVPRTQKRSSKRQTVPLTLWVKPQLKAEIQRFAASEGLSVSKTGAAFLEEATRQKLHVQHAVLLQPIIEQAIRKQMRGISTRLAWLLVRIAFDAGQTRGIVTNILRRQPGMTTQLLDHILDGSSKTAKGNITRRTPQIATLIDAVEQWMIAEDKEEA